MSVNGTKQTSLSEPTRGAPSLRSSRKVAFASLIGTTIEWYDFFIFGTAAALIFNTRSSSRPLIR
jgi:hypothetical protein